MSLRSTIAYRLKTLDVFHPAMRTITSSGTPAARRFRAAVRLMSTLPHKVEANANQAGHDSQEEQRQLKGKHAEACEPSIVLHRRWH
jgi:hypothetical protein